MRYFFFAERKSLTLFFSGGWFSAVSLPFFGGLFLFFLRSVLIPSLFYLSVVFPPPRRVQIILARKLARFFWRSNLEPLARDIVYKPRYSGGMNLPDLRFVLHLYFVVMHLHLFFFDKSRAGCFVRYNLGFVLRSLSMWSPSNVSPFAFTPPACYVFVKKFLLDRQMCSLDPIAWKSFKVVFSFVSSSFPVSTLPSMAVERSRAAWSAMSHPRLLGLHRDLHWRAAHEVLPTRRALHRRSLTPSPACPREGCSAEEYAAHVFWDCPFATAVWRRSLPCLHHHLQEEQLTYRLVMHASGMGPWQPEQWRVIWCIVSSVKGALWDARNILVLRREVLRPVAVWRMACKAVGDYYHQDIRRKGLQWATSVWLFDPP